MKPLTPKQLQEMKRLIELWAKGKATPKQVAVCRQLIRRHGATRPETREVAR